MPSIDQGEEKRWDQIAPMFRTWMEVDDYPQKLLSKIQFRPEWSVLDIGCGTGVIAINAALCSKSITALDISSKMLDILKSDADEKGIENISCVHRSWEDIQVGKDLAPHDIVITSRSIARTGDLKESLIKIDQMALRYVYVTAWGGCGRSLNRGLREELGYEYHDLADYVYIFNLLHQMGIRPNVEQLECKSTIIYPSLNEAVRNYQVLFNLSPEEIPIARKYLESHLIKQSNGQYKVPDNNPIWSLIWWKKNTTVDV